MKGFAPAFRSDAHHSRSEDDPHPGRLPVGPPVAIVDIGSNSVRLVVYEGLTRAPTPLFNEKVLCGLGRSVSTTGCLPDEAIDKALRALRRFRVLCHIMQVGEIHILATAAARDARNGADFIAKAEEAIGCEVELLTGSREAELSALGVLSGFYKPDGMVGDLGGGSLELIDIEGQSISEGMTFPLGGLALQDMSAGNLKKAEKLIEEALGRSSLLDGLEGRTFYAVGGTWRALARLHMYVRDYPLHVMHGYTIPSEDALDFVRIVERSALDLTSALAKIAEARRPLMPYGALVLQEIVKRGRPKEIVLSALGVREGYLFEKLEGPVREEDPLVSAASGLNMLRSRAPRHGEELIAWTDDLFAVAGLDEETNEERLRHAACLLADMGWRAHPDYRGEQSVNLVAHAAFSGIDHAGRAFLALAISFRHNGLSLDQVSPRLKALVTPRAMERARLLGAAFRVAYLLSAGMPDVLPRLEFKTDKNGLILSLPKYWEALGYERVNNRLKQLGKVMARDVQLQLV